MAINKIKFIIGITATVMVFYLFLNGFGYFESEPVVYIYDVEIKGLNNYTSFGVTDIIVPMPMKNGEQIFSDEELQYQSFGDWKSLMVVTKEGKMLALQTTKNNLSDINAKFEKYVNYSIDVKNPNKNALLYPVSNESTVNYTTYVYIDPKIQPSISNNSSINLEITLYGKGEMVNGRRTGQYRVTVHENVPEGVRGPILVKAWIYS